MEDRTYIATRLDGRSIEISGNALMRSFLFGDSMDDLAKSYGVFSWEIERIIRKETPDKWRQHE